MQIAVQPPPSYNAERMAKVKTKVKSETFRFTETASTLLLSCAEAAGISKAAVLEQAIRDYAKKKGITLPPKPVTEGE